jgi:hypothetical protein
MDNMLLVKNSDFPYHLKNNSELLKRIIIPYQPVIELKKSEETVIEKPLQFFFISSPVDKKNKVIINEKEFKTHIITEDELNIFRILRIVAEHNFLIKPSSNRSFFYAGYFLKSNKRPKALSKHLLKFLGLL